MKRTQIAIATDKGPEMLDVTLLPGMYTSGLCIAEVPNNGGGVSYGITHVDTGFAIIAACTDDFDLVASMLRKLWKQLSMQEKQLLKLKDPQEMKQHQYFDYFGNKVLAIKEQLKHKIAKQIEREIKEERAKR